MRHLILGYGDLVARLATGLAKAGHSVTVMDSSPDGLAALAEQPNIEVVLTSDSLTEDLRTVGIDDADAFLALSEDDNRNVMAAQLAKNIFRVKDAICLISDPKREEFYRGLGLNVVCPSLIVLDTLKRALNESKDNP